MPQTNPPPLEKVTLLESIAAIEAAQGGAEEVFARDDPDGVPALRSRRRRLDEAPSKLRDEAESAG